MEDLTMLGGILFTVVVSLVILAGIDFKKGRR